MGSDSQKEKDVQAALREEPAMAPPPEIEKIFREHHQRVVQAAYRVTGNASDAEDVLQSVFVRLLKGRQPPNTSENLGSYLHRAAVNASIDLLRSRRSRRAVALDDVADRMPGGSDSDPAQQQRSEEIRAWLRDAVSQLSSQASEIFLLRYLEGYGNQEIAELVGTSPGVVAVVLHRTRHRLRDELRSFLGGTS
jgi:RNA polymerase sigma-70 factor (ECF subfamily)